MAAFARILSRAAERNALVDKHVFFNDCRFADDNARVVIDKNARRDFRRGMNFDSRSKSRELAYYACKKFHMMSIKEIGNSMSRECVYSRVGEPYFEFRARRGVVLLCKSDIFPK